MDCDGLQIVDTLKKGLNIRTRAPVKTVAVLPQSKRVQVTLADGTSVIASTVVVAVPPPVRWLSVTVAKLRMF